jgi:hypothetical protein
MIPLEVSPLEYHSRLKLDRSNIFSPDSYMSKSRLWELNESTLWRWRNAPEEKETTTSMTWGSLVDCMLLTPELTASSVIINPFADFRSKAAQDLKKSATAKGQIVVSVEDMRLAETAVAAVLGHPVAGPVVRNAKKQVVLLGKIKDVQCKALLDLVPDGPCLYDLKTTRDLTPRGISKAIHSFAYHIQAAWYLRLWNLCFPDQPKDRWRFIWQSNTAPFEVAVTELPAHDIESGKEWAGYQLDRLIAATKANKWPGFGDDKVTMIGRPAYASIQDEEDLDGLVAAPGTDGGEA